MDGFKRQFGSLNATGYDSRWYFKIPFINTPYLVMTRNFVPSDSPMYGDQWSVHSLTEKYVGFNYADNVTFQAYGY